MGCLGRGAVWLDITGIGLVGAAIAWTLLSASASGTDGVGVALLFVASAGAVAAGRMAGSLGRWVAPLLVVTIAGVVAVQSSADLFSRAPLSGPFGYANAKATFFIQGALAGMMLAAGTRFLGGRLFGIAAAIGFAVVPVASASLTSGVLVMALPAVVLGLAGEAGARAAVVGSGALFITALVTTVALGAVYPGQGTLVGAAGDVLSERRLTLWHEALEIMGRNPLSGIGPGRFDQVSPTAREDQDARWAHHGFLQQGAEAGIPGFALLGLLFLWGFARLAVTAGADAVTAVGAVALAALGIHACIDYILHFPAVPLVSAVLVGAATAAPRRVDDGDRYAGA